MEFRAPKQPVKGLISPLPRTQTGVGAKPNSARYAKRQPSPFWPRRKTSKKSRQRSRHCSRRYREASGHEERSVAAAAIQGASVRLVAHSRRGCTKAISRGATDGPKV